MLIKIDVQNAVIKESLRIGPGISSGLPRIVPPGGAIIDGKKVAAGVSSQILFIFLLGISSARKD